MNSIDKVTFSLWNYNKKPLRALLAETANISKGHAFHHIHLDIYSIKKETDKQKTFSYLTYLILFYLAAESWTQNIRSKSDSHTGLSYLTAMRHIEVFLLLQ